MPVITQLHVYPVKSMRGISLKESELSVRGLSYDRNWMVIDEKGDFLTQRQIPELSTIRVHISKEKLHLTALSGDSIGIPLIANNLKPISVEVWGDYCEALEEGDEIAQWFTKTLKPTKVKSLRLVRFKDSFRRQVDKNYLKEENSHTAFADSFPFLITSEDSLKLLNDHLLRKGKNPVSMDRFRPNIVIQGLKPLQENHIEKLVSVDGRYCLGIRKPCKRCKITTVDQHTGQIKEPKEPLHTLTLMNTVRDLHGAYFGQNSILISGEGEKIKVGDLIEI